MAVLSWYLVIGENVRYCRAEQVTFYRVPDTDGHVKLITLYIAPVNGVKSKIYIYPWICLKRGFFAVWNVVFFQEVTLITSLRKNIYTKEKTLRNHQYLHYLHRKFFIKMKDFNLMRESIRYPPPIFNDLWFMVRDMDLKTNLLLIFKNLFSNTKFW